MKSREELRNDYEEALFAMIIDEIMDLEGEALIAERERLAFSDEHKLPDDLNDRCIAIINDAFEAKKTATKKHRTRTLMRTLLVAAVVMCIMFTSVYASVPAVRQATDEMMMAFSNVCVRLIFGDAVIHVDDGHYVFAGIPEKFGVIEEGEGDGTKWCLYSNEESTLMIEVNYDYDYKEECVDLEDADGVIEIEFDEYEGVSVIKNDRVHLSLYDTERNNTIQITSHRMDYDFVIDLIKGIKFVN